jgi:hypothetical protein
METVSMSETLGQFLPTFYETVIFVWQIKLNRDHSSHLLTHTQILHGSLCCSGLKPMCKGRKLPGKFQLAILFTWLAIFVWQRLMSIGQNYTWSPGNPAPVSTNYRHHRLDWQLPRLHGNFVHFSAEEVSVLWTPCATVPLLYFLLLHFLSSIFVYICL